MRIAAAAAPQDLFAAAPSQLLDEVRKVLADLEAEMVHAAPVTLHEIPQWARPDRFDQLQHDATRAQGGDLRHATTLAGPAGYDELDELDRRAPNAEDVRVRPDRLLHVANDDADVRETPKSRRRGAVRLSAADELVGLSDVNTGAAALVQERDIFGEATGGGKPQIRAQLLTEVQRRVGGGGSAEAQPSPLLLQERDLLLGDGLRSRSRRGGCLRPRGR